MRIGHVDRQRARLEQRIGPRVGGRGVDVEAQRQVHVARGRRSGGRLALGEPLLEIVDRRAAAQERVVEQELLVQRDVRLDAAHHHLGQRDAHPRDRLLARVAVRDDLADHRVVVRRHEVVGVRVRVDADARAARRVPRRDAARRRHERPRVLGVDAAFDRVAALDDVALAEAQLLARRRCGSAPARCRCR